MNNPVISSKKLPFLDIVTGVLLLLVVVFLSAHYSLIFVIMGVYATVSGYRNPVQQYFSSMLSAAGIIILIAAGLYFLNKSLWWITLPLALLMFNALGNLLLTVKHSHSVIRLYLLIALTSMLLLGGGFIGIPYLLKNALGNELNELAPEFTLQPLNTPGENLPVSLPVNSEALKGKVVVLDFWASWCRPCVAEFEDLQEVYNQFINHDEIAIYAVNTSWNNDTREKARDFLNRYNYTVPACYDEKGQVTASFSVSSIPTVIVLDKKGNIRYRHEGYNPAEQFDELLVGQIQQYLE
jgi:thiol-disulfide isomerase/thioredoxin